MASRQLVWYSSLSSPHLLTVRLYRDAAGYTTAWGLIINDKGYKEYYSKGVIHYASNALALHALFIEVDNLLMDLCHYQRVIANTSQLRHLRIMLEQLSEYTFDCIYNRQLPRYDLLRFSL